MPFNELLRLALASLSANKLRSMLTMLGIAVGVFSVIGVMTAITAMQSSITTGLNVLGANSFQISKFPAVNFGGPDRRFANRRDITYAQARRFQDLLGDAAQVSSIIRRGGRQVFHLDRRTNPNTLLNGTDQNFLNAYSFVIERGRNLSNEDVEFGRPVTVIGNDVYKRLFLDEDPIGQQVRVDGQQYTVVGVFEAKGTRFGEPQDGFMIIPISRWLAVYGNMGRTIRINVQGPDAETLARVQDQATGAMRVVRGLKPEQENDFEIFSNDSLIRSFNEISGVVALGAFVISAIALAAAGVGIMNIMLVSVTERTKEIGVRKSLGAKRAAILRQFLVEAVILSVLGGLAGVAVGIGLGNVVAIMLGVPLVMPWFWAGLGVAICAGIGVGFGYYPARRAALLDPIEALRFE
jgi:putative ABC transport system permease protein